MPTGTLYPAIDGSTPGEHPDAVGQDITDVPLDPLFEDSSVLSEPGASQVSEFAPPAPNAPVEGAEFNPQPSDRPPANKSPVQARIDKLTRRAYERERENTVLQNQLAAVVQGLEAANARIAQLSAPRPITQPVAGLSSDPFDSSGKQPSASPVGLDEARLEEILNRRLEPVLDAIKARSDANALAMAHEQSFAEATKEYPELARPDSEFRKHFNEVYDKSPLKALPDAPYQIALQVRGLLSDARRDRQNTSERKALVGVTVPTQSNPEGTGTREVNGLPADEWKKYQANKEKLRLGTATVNDRMQVLRVNQFLSQRK